MHWRCCWAHEIAHVLHRDPIARHRQKRGHPQLVVGLLSGSPDLRCWAVPASTPSCASAGDGTTADAAALAVVHRQYGHVGGADALFGGIAQRTRTVRRRMPAFFSSHPLDRDRLQAITDTAHRQGWRDHGQTTPLPAAFGAWMRDASDRAVKHRDRR